MLDFLRKGSKKFASPVSYKEQEVFVKEEPKILGAMDAMDFIQNKFINNKMDVNDIHKIQSFAMSGDRESRKRLTNIFLEIIKVSELKVSGYTDEELAKETFAYKYGLEILDKYYLDSTVDEIRVNRKDNIRIVRKGISMNIDEKFNNEEEIERIIKRLIMEDTGISLDRSNPQIESVLKDGSRLTAVCYPVSESWNFILRKHDSFKPTLENYIAVGTLDKFVWDRLSILTRGNAKLLFSGNVSAGKTTLLKSVVGELDPRLRIGVLGKDSEVQLQEKYPDRDIVEFQEQPQLGVTMKELFQTMLRESIDALVVEEFRGSGEAIEAVRACSRGLPNAFSTAHFNNAEQAIEGMGLLLIEEGLNLSLELAKIRAARAFNIIVQLFGDAITGKKKLLAISEVMTDEKGNIKVQDLVTWKSDTDQFFGTGKWVELNQPSDTMLKKILVNVNRKEVEELGWDTSRI